MKNIYYLQKHPVKLGDIVEYNGIKTVVTEELIELNPELFRVEENTQPIYFKCIKDSLGFTLNRIYKQVNHKDYPQRVILQDDDNSERKIINWQGVYKEESSNCFELTTKAEWDKQELLDKAKRDYPIGTMLNSKYGRQKVLSDKPFMGRVRAGTVQINTDQFPGGMTIYTPEDGWCEVLPLKFITEDSVKIYGDTGTWMVYPKDSDDVRFSYGPWDGDSECKGYKYFYHKENALAYIEKHKEKTLEDYENMLLSKEGLYFSSDNVHFNIWSWMKVNEPKLYYTKILQLIADDLNDGRYIHIKRNTSYHLSNAHEVNIHCGGDEGCVYFKSKELAFKARGILGDKLEYLFN